jgi:hypothetical protein
MKIDDVLGQPFPENVQKVVDWLESQPKDEVFEPEEVAAALGFNSLTITCSPYLEGWCVEFPLGVEYYGSKSAIKLFRRKHKKLFGKKVL